MEKIGIIAEYNPFHNGHVYHLKKAKEMFPDAAIILVLSTSFTQRGTPSILNKWEKTKIALQYGVDLVIELPFAFATQSADFFAQAAIEILNAVGVNYIVFGSESNDCEKLYKLAQIEIQNPLFSQKIQSFLKKGVNYPTALNQALRALGGEEINSPNDLLALSYIKEIIKQNAPIQPISIQRTNSYHDSQLQEKISSATSIRKALQEKKEIAPYVPKEVEKLLKKQNYCLEDYYPFLKFQIYSSNDLSIYLDVDEGIENKIIKEIDHASSLEELLVRIKTKRYTLNKINRMFCHILCSFTKEEKKNFEHVEYLRILGFSNQGKKVLREIKKTCKIPIYTTFQKNIRGFQLEKRITAVYASILKEETKQKLILQEYQNKPIQKEE